MDIKIYQRFTNTTALPSAKNLPYLISGLAAEAGEVCDKYAKFVRDNTGTAEFIQDLQKEMGDVLWFVSQLHNFLGLDMAETMVKNRDKLIDRQNRNTLGGSGDDR